MLPVPRLHRHFFLTIALIAGTLSISRVVIADNETLSNVLPVKQVVRYSVIRPHPTSGQQDLLAVAVAIRVPNDIVTVGGALEMGGQGFGLSVGGLQSLNHRCRRYVEAATAESPSSIPGIASSGCYFIVGGFRFCVGTRPRSSSPRV